MINYDLKKIRSIIFDIDGVLSQNNVNIGEDGQPVRTANIKDGYALQLAVKKGIKIAIMTGAKVQNIRTRYESLGVKDIYLACAMKIETYREYKKRHGLSDDEIIYVGDDIPDLQVMQQCGCPCCPADAAPEIRQASTYISQHNGGDGVGRDIIEQVLRSKGEWIMDAEAFGW